MFGQHLHHVAIHAQFTAIGVLWQIFRHPHLLGGFVDGLQSVGVGLVGAEQPVAASVELDQITDQLAEGVGVLGQGLTGNFNGDGQGINVGPVQIRAQQAAVGMGVGAHAPLALGRQLAQLSPQQPFGIE